MYFFAKQDMSFRRNWK